MRLTRNSRRSGLIALAAATPCAHAWIGRSPLPPAQRLLGRARAAAIAACAQHKLELTLCDADDTNALGAQLAQLCRAGDVIFLQGDYGAGKTCLARGFVRHWLGSPDEQVTSPSYLIDNVYPDSEGFALCPGVTVHHMDLWRLPEGKVTQLVDLPTVFRDCVSLIEWPQRLGEAATPAERLEVHLAISDDGGGSAAARADDGEGDDAYDDDEYDEPPPQPRIATLSAVGASWSGRLECLELA